LIVLTGGDEAAFRQNYLSTVLMAFPFIDSMPDIIRDFAFSQ
jgi:hypothetical protein